MMTGAGEQLFLFDCGGIDMAALRQRRDSLRRATRATRTMKAYSSDWRQFESWCSLTGRDAFPATIETVSLYVTWLLTERSRKVTTAERHVSAVAHFHKIAGYPIPIGPDVRQVITAVRRDRRETPVGKAAIGVDEILRICKGCDARTRIGVRDRALVTLGFATSLRGSELCRLQLSDLSFEGRGIAVIIRYSKTDQEGRGRVIAVWAGKRAATDPVRVMKSWISRRGRWPGPLFCRVQTGDTIIRQPLSVEAVCEAVKRAVERVGLDSAKYGSHSLRAGAVTAAAELGRSDQEIMALSGHKSAAVMKTYVRRARVFAGRNPLAGVL
jgi:integrase